MNSLTCVIIGGGHAGVAALKYIQASTLRMAKKQRIRFVLIDKQPAHLRKVMLFRPAASGEEITVPWSYYTVQGVEFIQGTVTFVNGTNKSVQYTDATGNDVQMHYDLLVVALGSVVRQPDPSQGGIVLSDLQAAARIRQHWLHRLREAAGEANAEKRTKLMSVAVVGAGISGIETSAELARAMRKEAQALRLNPDDIRIYLLNAHDRLFPEGPEKVRRKLEDNLRQCGVTVLHQRKALREEAGVVTIDFLGSKEALAVGLCIWTIGLVPNPAVRDIGLPLTADGRVKVDESYRVERMAGVYSIGDCAKVVDSTTGKADQMTCKEGGMQAYRLGKVVRADLNDRPAPVHKSVSDLFAIGLGENRGLVWVRMWGIHLVVTGKLAWKLKNIAWKSASMLR